jgi:cysteine desulfurase
MWANNETGVIQPVEDFVRAANEAGALVHVDAVQTVGKLSIRFRRSGIHFLSVSGHKMYGPKGIGVLALARHGLGRQVTIRPMILGGGQERSLRSGTENTSGIVGMGAAAVEAESIQPLAIASLRDRFEKGLREIADSVRFIGGSSPRVCNTSLFRIPGRSAEIITHKLDRQGIAVSSGSACHSGSAAPSKVLISMGLNAAEAGEAVRVSLSRFTTEEEIDIVLTRIGAILADGISRSRSSPSIGIEPQSGPDMSKRTEAGPEKEAA